MTTSQSLSARKAAAVSRGVATREIYAVRAENAELWDAEGRRFLDFAAGIAVNNTGHRHPTVMAAVAEQAQAFTHTCFHVAPYEGYIRLAERLNKLTPGSFEKKTMFATTGAEAVENAVKMARAFTGRSGIISFSGAFHGRTLLGMALTGKVAPYKKGFGAMPPEVVHATFPNAMTGVTEEAAIADLERLFASSVDPERVAAIIIEPVQGEGGFNIAPASLMEGLRAVCDRHGILLIADEVQTGFGRTGKLFAMEYHDVRADIITMAKSLAGGMPLSAVCGRAEVMDAPAPGGLGGTYAGNPLAVAAAHAVMDVIDSEGLLERSVRLGAQLQGALNEWRDSCPAISDVRGLGSMVAVEFADPASREPSATLAARVQKEALARGLLLLTCGTYGNVIRFLYPLTIPDAQFSAALATLHEALRAATAETITA